jgi:LmbE family N-acetylglucosaminyl deacetylase
LENQEMKEHVYFVNAHPDDLIACMGLCMQLSADERFNVHVVNMTRGERGLSRQRVPLAECAAIRTKEEETVCGAMGLKPRWLREIDGEACASKEACQELADMFIAEPPRAIFTQWPVDRHVDHMVCSTIALNALRFAAGDIGGQLKTKTAATEVYFYAYAGNSIGFVPTHYFPLDEKAMDKKCALISKYECQNGVAMARQERMESLCHGQSVRTPYAEAYQSFQPYLPGKKCIFDQLITGVSPSPPPL